MDGKMDDDLLIGKRQSIVYLIKACLFHGLYFVCVVGAFTTLN